MLSQGGEYEVLSNDWIRRHGRRKGTVPIWPMSIVTTFDQHTQLDQSSFSFIDSYFQSGYPSSKQFAGSSIFDDLVSLSRDAETSDKRWYGINNLGKAILLAAESQLLPLIRDHVLPMFFKLYPEGKIVVIQNHRDYFRISRRFKGAYTAEQTPWPDLKKDFTKGFLTLDDWQSVSVLDYTRVVIDLFCYMFYPFVSGFQANQLGLTFLLVFDPPERYEPPAFPSDWLAIPRSHSEFGEEDFDRKAALLEPKGAVAEHAGHQKYLHTKAFSAAEIVDLLRWFVEAGNRLFFELTDLTNFTAGFVPTGPIDPIFAFEHSITIDRMIRKTLGAMLLYEISSAKATVFEVADLYDANSELFSGTGKTEFFKTLFDTKDGLALIRSQLATLPIPFADYFQGLATELYGELEQTILESVWLKSKVGSAGVSVRNKALTGENVEPSNKFVANVMRALRNAHHGYFSSGAPQKGPSRYLFPITGNVPDSITALPTLWLLAYLANPKLTGWNHLEVSHYD